MKKCILSGLLISSMLFLGTASFAQSNADYMFAGTKHPSYSNTYEAIDTYVKGLKASDIPVSMSYADAAKKICAKSTTEIQKARAIFTWVATNITYDTTFDASTCYSADGTWKKKSGVCQGYALLYNELANSVGLKTDYVRGFSKSYKYEYGDDFGSHGWSIVHLSNRDLLLDPCWGAGNVNGKTFTFSFKDYWFDVDPNLMIASHFPRESKFQALKTPVTQNKFASLPDVSPAVNFGGVDGKELYDFYVRHNKAWFPVAYGVLDEYLKKGIVINKMPMAGTLKVGVTYTANLTLPSGCTAFFVVDGNKRVAVQSGVDVQITPTTEKDINLFATIGGQSQGLFGYKASASPSLEHESMAMAANNLILASSGSSGDSGVVTTITDGTGNTHVATVTDAKDPGNSTEVTNVPDDYTTPLRVPARVNAPIQSSKGFKNKLGMIFDPYAKISFDKDGKVIGNVKVKFDKSGNLINFIDKNNAKKLYGQFLYKEQYWKKYDSALDSAIGLNMDQFYSSINLYQTDLYRDAKGKCVGPNCNVTNPNVTQKESDNAARKPNKTGLNADNLATVSLTCTDGQTRDNQAHGKGKVLIFGKVLCGNCRATAQSIKAAGGNLGNVDVIEIEINKASKADVVTFKSECGASNIPFAYDTTGTANSMMWNYLRKLGSVSSVTLGVIVYIDANNKIQYVESGYKTADHIKSIVADYL